MIRFLLGLIALLLSITLTAQISPTNNIDYDMLENELHVQKPVQSFTSTQSIKQRLDSLITENYDGQTWSYGQRYIYSYDNDGLPTQYIRYPWIDGVWTPSARYDYFHNVNDQLIERFYYSWDGAQWNLRRRYQYVYNADGQIAEISLDDWEESTMLWLDYVKNNYMYDANQKVIQSINTLWNANTASWENIYQTDYTYNMNDEVSERIHYEWDEAGSQWKNYRKYIHNYDTANNLTPYIIQVWDTDANDWLNWTKFDYNYDNTYAYNDLIIPFSEERFNHLCTGYITSSWSSGSWETSGRGTYYYSEQELTANTNIAANILTIAPNPSNDFVVFDIENPTSTTVELYNTQGKIISTQTLSSEKKLSVRYLPKGVYFYYLQHADKRSSGKIVVK